MDVDIGSLVDATGTAVLLAGTYGLYTLGLDLVQGKAVIDQMNAWREGINCVSCAVQWGMEMVPQAGGVDASVDNGAKCAIQKPLQQITNTARSGKRAVAFEYFGSFLEAKELNSVMTNGYATVDKVQRLVSGSS